jgi:hypothetical protein
MHSALMQLVLVIGDAVLHITRMAMFGVANKKGV